MIVMAAEMRHRVVPSIVPIMIADLPPQSMHRRQDSTMWRGPAAPPKSRSIRGDANLTMTAGTLLTRRCLRLISSPYDRHVADNARRSRTDRRQTWARYYPRRPVRVSLSRVPCF